MKGLTAREQAEVLDASAVKDLPAQQVLFGQDEPAEALYLVESGRLKLTQLTASGQAVTVRLVAPGELCAAVAVLDGKTYPFTACAAEETRVRLWPRARLRELFRRLSRLEGNVLEIVGAHAREMMDKFRELATEPVPQRVARALLRLAESGVRGVDGIRIERVTQQDLAELTATTLYSVNRVLSDWQAEGLLKRSRARILILDEAQLRSLAEA
jgi:CRP-like cAMP-binding protein